MGKKKFIFLVSIILFITLVSIVYLKGGTYYHITNANKHLDTGIIKLLIKEEDIKDMLEQKFTVIPGFGGKGYSNEVEGIEIDFSGFPDVLDNYVLTAIKTTNPKHAFYGIHPGDNADNATKNIMKNGFVKLESTDQHQYRYEKGKILVNLYVNSEAKIEKIIIHLQSTNKENVVF